MALALAAEFRAVNERGTERRLAALASELDLARPARPVAQLESIGRAVFGLIAAPRERPWHG